MKKKKKSSSLISIMLVLMFFIGLSVLLYPTIADYVNSRVQSKAIFDYEAYLQSLKPEDYTAFFEAADAYNKEIAKLSFPFMSYNQVEGYEETLDVNGIGMIGYIDIDKIRVELPIYHGTSEAVLNRSAGHLQGSSLPAGGESTHIVLSAHRGLPSAKLFTDLDRLEIGDTFTITVLDRVLTYEVDQIRVVLPQEVDELYIKEGEDLCTLVTCTPYGINTHSLLVRGHRVETLAPKPVIFVKNEGFMIDPLIVAPAVAAPMLLVLLIILLVRSGRKSPKAKRKEDVNEE